MPAARSRRPAAHEYDAYYANYISRAPEGDVVATMTAQIGELETAFRTVPVARAAARYAPGKWTLREVLGHLVDTERVFSYRATAFSRGDGGPLPSYDQAAWNPFGRYDERPIETVLDEWIAVRRASIALADAMPEEAWERTGVASGLMFTVRSLLWILPGHVAYHMEQVRTRYP